MGGEGHGPQATRGFTLVEALVSITIAAGMLVMIAVIFRQSSEAARSVRASARVHQVARQVFELFGRDLAGLTRRGFMVLRAQTRKLSDSPDDQTNHILALYYDEQGELQYLGSARTDMLVMLSSGYHISAGDSGKVSSFARVIWGQTERINGNDNEWPQGRSPASGLLKDHPEFLGIHQVLSRNQTLLLPDRWSVHDDAYTGSNRGPDYYNMCLSDLNNLFWTAMAGHTNQYLYGPNFGRALNDPRDAIAADVLMIENEDLQPWRPLAKVFRLGRNGPGPRGLAPGSAGAGDLTRGQVHCEPYHRVEPTDQAPDERYTDDMAGWRGHMRTRIRGSGDFHRILAFGVPVFQVDFSDGRRKDGKLVFYPEVAPSSTFHKNVPSYSWRLGPGPPMVFAWNRHSPEHVRASYLRKLRPDIDLRDICSPYARIDPADWWFEKEDQFMTDVGRSGWAWPKAIRLRILILDSTADPPVPYEFVQVFTLLAQ